ncbi:hypothetical protein Q7P35_007754 [Cladosporium inversicolor]
MPIVWNAETEAKLLAGLFKVCDIKVGSQQLKELAEIIGPDCTPKAVTHRLAKFKKMAGSFNGGKKGGDAAGEDADGEDGAATPKKAKKAAKVGKASKKRAAEDDAEEDDGEEETIKKPKLEASEDSA